MPIYTQMSFECDQCGEKDSGQVTHYSTRNTDGQWRQAMRFPGDWVTCERGIFCNEECLYAAKQGHPIKFKRG